jgi:PAS domain S-box-containing protein
LDNSDSHRTSDSTFGRGHLGDGSETEFLGQLMEAIPAPVFFKDSKQIYRGCNAAFERFLGLPRERIIGKSVFEVAPPGLAQRYFDQDQALLDNPPVQVYEAEVQTGEGKRAVVFHKATYVDAGGQVAGIVGVILDITERRQAEDALRRAYEEAREANERLRLAAGVFEIASEGIVIAQRAEGDAEYRIVEVNDAYCRLIGQTKESALNMSIVWLQSGVERDLVACAQESLRATGRWEGEVHLPRSDGTKFPALLSLTIIPVEGESAARLVGVFTDLTEIKRAQDLLK